VSLLYYVTDFLASFPSWYPSPHPDICLTTLSDVQTLVYLSPGEVGQSAACLVILFIPQL